MEKLSETIQFLMDYPLEETPYPEHYPDDLKFDLYPGKDFVVGLCEENIDTAVNLYHESKNKEVMKLWIQILNTVRAIRLAKLHLYHHPKPKSPEPSFETVVKQALF